MAPEQDLDAILARIEQREKSARRRSILYSLVPIVVAVAVLGYTGYQVNETGKELERTSSELNETNKKLEDTKLQLAKATDFKSLAHPLTPREVKEIASRYYAAREGRVLGKIFDLQMMGVSWHLSGQSPGEGFDSPSFAAYVLERTGVPVGEIRPGIRLSAQLMENLDPIEEPAPGDLLFYPGGYVMFYYEDMKGEPFVIGMTPFGIVSLDPGFDEPDAIRRPGY
jgi:hypothetical protein